MKAVWKVHVFCPRNRCCMTLATIHCREVRSETAFFPGVHLLPYGMFSARVMRRRCHIVLVHDAPCRHPLRAFSLFRGHDTVGFALVCVACGTRPFPNCSAMLCAVSPVCRNLQFYRFPMRKRSRWCTTFSITRGSSWERRRR